MFDDDDDDDTLFMAAENISETTEDALVSDVAFIINEWFLVLTSEKWGRLPVIKPCYRSCLPLFAWLIIFCKTIGSDWWD